MKVAVVLIAAIASVTSGSVRVVRQSGSGWGVPPPPPPSTPGWTTPPPTTTAGWTTHPPPPTTTTPGWTTPPPPPPTTTPGWSPPLPPPTPAGWGAPPPPPPSGLITNIDLNAALAAAGSGWAAENHAENVQVIGAGGWGGPNAQLAISAAGESEVAQDGSILQVTSQDGETASSLNIVSVDQIAAGSEGEVVDALGLSISNAQSGWAGAAGEGASAADATSSLTVNPAAAALGLSRP